MAEVPDKILKIVQKYIDLLRENNIPVESAFLFGSYAKGNYNDWSDIDLAIVSEIFEGKRISDRSMIRRITLALSSDIEVLPFHPKDFTKENPFVKEIIETGIKVA